MAVASVGRRGLWSIPLAAIAVATVALTPSANGGAAIAVAGRTASADVCPAALSPGHPIPTTAEGLNCQAASRPGDAAELASLRAMLQARETAPFATAARGAYASAVAQSNTLPLSTLAGGASSWSPAGPSVLCDGHTDNSNLCPLVNNTSDAESNGDYTISALGHKTLSGRMDALAGDPTNPSRLFAAPAVGGVFETTDAGGHWHSIGDALPTQAMGAVVYDAPFHRIIAGSGDPSFGGSGIQGHGIFYSDNDGGTWQTAPGIPDLSLNFRVVVSPADSSGRTVYAATSMGLFRSNDGGVHYVNERLQSSPSGYTVPDPTQGGKQVSCQGNTTAPLCFFANIVTDVVVKKSSSANAPAGAVMAVLGWRAGQKVDLQANGTANTSCQLNGTATNCLQAPQNGIYTSSDGAPGSFSFQSHAGSPAGLDFAPNDVVGRTSLGIADGAGQNNDAVFALVQDAIKLQHCADDPVDADVAKVCNADVQALGYATVLDGAYATYDFGKTWTKIMNFSQLHQGGNTALVGVPGYSPGVQSWYNNWIKPDPTAIDGSGNPTRVVFGLEEIWENNINLPGVLSNPWVAYQGQGGTSPWVVIGRYWNDCGGLNTTGGITCNPTTNSNTAQPYSTTHPDQHAYLFVPDGSGGVTLYAGNDGGAYKQHVAAGIDFSNDNWGDGINNGLYSLQPYDASIAKDGTIVSGLQDNGEMKIAPGGKEAHTIFGGDGFMTMIDPNNSQNIIEEYTYGVTSLTLNGGKDWYNIDFGCGSDQSQFSTSLEQDPTMPGHVVEGCTQILEAGGGGTKEGPTVFANPCAAPPGADPFRCQVGNAPWVSVFDLGQVAAPGTRPADCAAVNCDPFNIPSAMGVRGEAIYAGYCGYCDVVTGGLPFHSGIATNVGGDKAPAIGTGDGWHFASGHCSACGTANGLLPQRYITSVQIDPGNTKTIYVTLGGYARRWIPPGALGDDVSNVGSGHIFVSHDAGENFTDISGNLPDIAANYTLIHNGALLVATDLGVYIAPTTAGKSWSALGTGLPNAPVFTLRAQPGNPDHIVAATYGRGVQQYDFNGSPAVNVTQALPTTASGAAPATSALPNTSRIPAPPWPGFGALVLMAGLRLRRRQAQRV